MKAKNRFCLMLRMVALERAMLAATMQVALHQGDVGRLHGHVGTGSHGDANISPRQRRGVVDASPDHGHHLA